MTGLGLGLGLDAAPCRPTAFDLAALFTSGEVGVALDPSRTDMLFQDPQGQLPVLAPGDPVGLVLDTSRGAQIRPAAQSLGPELFRDPAFATDFSGILANIGTTLAIGGGDLTVINSNTYAGRWTDRSIPLAPNKTYLVEFGVSEFLGGSTSVQLRTGDINLNHNPASGATSEIYSGLGLGDHAIVVANTSGATADRYIGTYVGEGGGAYGHRLSHFSIREIPGNHALQSVNDDYRPTLGVDARGVNYLQFDGIDDHLRARFGATSAQPNTVAMAIQIDASTTQSVSDGLATGGRNALYHTPGHLRAYAGEHSGRPSPSGKTVVLAQFDGAQSFSRVNGVEISGDFGVQGGDGLTIGTNYNGANPLSGRIYGALVINRRLTVAEIARVEQYLASKMGVSL